MKIGYARVSTKEQSLNLQKDALEKVGCETIFSEHISGAKSDRLGESNFQVSRCWGRISITTR